MPGATEVLFALGLGDSVVGVTHECDWPPEAQARRAVTASVLDTEELGSSEIDQAVSQAAEEDLPLYAIGEEVWDELQPDIVVVQELCDVCAVTVDDARNVVAARKVGAELLDYSPSSLGDTMVAIKALGARLDAEGEAEEIVGVMQACFDRVTAALAEVESIPRVFFTEWLEPPYSAGHWVPDMVSLARGTDVAGMSGEPSHRMRWSDVAELRPDVVILAPCGFDLDRTLAEVAPLELSANLLETPAREESKVFAVDANGYFSRPAPRLADGVEQLAYLLHPDAYPDPGLPWSRIRL